MLSSILKKSDCAACKFCCSFKRTSLWETPIFSKEDVEKLSALYPQAKFRPINKDSQKNTSFTIDISNDYKTNNPDEEAPCPFLNPHEGCILPQELKPFDCKIWPLRVVSLSSKEENSETPDCTKHTKLAVALTPTCPAINKIPEEQVQKLVTSGIGKTILEYAKEHPDIIKEYSEFLSKILM
jgi:Fe-S-cluster containining protein